MYLSRALANSALSDTHPRGNFEIDIKYRLLPRRDDDGDDNDDDDDDDDDNGDDDDDVDVVRMTRYLRTTPSITSVALGVDMACIMSGWHMISGRHIMSG